MFPKKKLKCKDFALWQNFLGYINFKLIFDLRNVISRCEFKSEECAV